MAGWNYPEISLEDLLKAIKGFIDMLILASGYQSSGRLAHWDSGNIKRALQWALFLEDVIGSLNSQDEYRDSLEELDVALCEMISMPYFPKGIEHLSSKTLSTARNLMLEHLTHTLPLRDLHLRALVTATVEMDFHMLPNADSDCIDKHFEELMHSESKKPAFNVSRHLMEDSVNTSMMTSPSRKANDAACSFSAITARELGRRHMAVSSLSAAETCLEMLSRSVYHLSVSEPGKNLHDGVAHTGALMSDEVPIDPITWNLLKSRNLSYLLDKRTIRLVSGANLILSAPEDQWVRVFGRLNISTEAEHNLCETVELLLLGCVASKWKNLIEHLMSSSYKPVTISKLCQEVLNLVVGGCKNLCCKDNITSSKDRRVVRFLEGLLSSQLYILWKLSPILAAFAIPSWSPLFRSYLRELECQLRGDTSLASSCDCAKDGKEHRECEGPLGDTKRGMKILSVLGMKWRGRRTASAVTLLSLQKRAAPRNWCVGRHLEWRVRLWCRKLREAALGCQRKSMQQFSYDPQSYSQNFDDGHFKEHLSPLAPL
nr:uncharacterized protein LOC109173736 [Ipomoea batatas]